MAVTEESKLASKVVEQSSDIKFTEEELKSLNDLNQGYQTKQQQFGQLKVQKLLIQQQLVQVHQPQVHLLLLSQQVI